MKNYGDRSSEAITVTPSATLFNPNTGEFEEASRDLVREREQNRARLEEQFAELQMQVAEWEGLAREALKGLRENAEHGIAIERAIAALRRLKRESYEVTTRIDLSPKKVAKVVQKERQPLPVVGAALRALLVALAQADKPLTKAQVAIRAGRSVKSSTTANALSQGRTNGWIDGYGEMTITEAGREVVRDVEPLPKGRRLAEWWYSKLGKCEREILEVFVEGYPIYFTREEICERTPSGYSSTSSTVANALSKLRTLELIEGRKEMRANPDLRE